MHRRAAALRDDAGMTLDPGRERAQQHTHARTLAPTFGVGLSKSGYKSDSDDDDDDDTEF